MRKLLTGMLMLVLLLPILAACGASGTGGDTTGTTGSSAAGASTAASGLPTPAETEAPSTAASTAASSPAAAASGSAATSASGSGLRVALVTDVGKVNDGTFNQFAYEGLQRAERELGVTINYVESQQPTDFETNLERFAAGDADIIIGVGFLMGDAMQKVATAHPDKKFAIVDFAYDAAPPNLKGLVFAEDQAAYMVGTMAALVSQSNTIGVVGGVQIPPVEKFVKGYEAGAKAQNPDIRVLSVYIPSFTDPAAGAEAARSQIAEGADVIFGAGGPTGSGGIEVAAREGKFVIGVDQDEYATTFKGGSAEGADKLITSALKRVDNAVFTAVQDAINGNFTNEVYVGTAENGGVDYAPAHDADEVVTAEIKAKVDEVKQGLANGTIKTGVE